jgi:ketosteroid isomerase-like protein
MSEENVEIVRRGLEALDRRDLSSWLAVNDEDCEVVPSRDWPEPGVRGPEAVFDWVPPGLRLPPAVPDHRHRVHRRRGRQLVLQYRTDLRGRESGARFEIRRWCVVTMRKGRALRTERFTDRAEALEAAGLSE